MNLKNRCLICNTDQNLNTTMKVKVDNKEYEVAICDEHSEDITVGKARELVSGKLTKIKEFMEQAAELGLTISESKGGILTTQSKPVEIEDDLEEVVEDKPAKPMAKPVPATTPKIAIPKMRIPKVSHPEARAHDSLDVDKAVLSEIEAERKKGRNMVIPEAVEIEPQEGQDASGAPMMVPKRIVDKDGSTTTIVINKTSDAEIQRRAKEQETLAKQGGPTHLFINGFNLHECSLCRSTGLIQNGTKSCPRCKGSGWSS